MFKYSANTDQVDFPAGKELDKVQTAEGKILEIIPSGG